jgi:hypothetical protein
MVYPRHQHDVAVWQLATDVPASPQSKRDQRTCHHALVCQSEGGQAGMESSTELCVSPMRMELPWSTREANALSLANGVEPEASMVAHDFAALFLYQHPWPLSWNTTQPNVAEHCPHHRWALSTSLRSAINGETGLPHLGSLPRIRQSLCAQGNRCPGYPFGTCSAGLQQPPGRAPCSW